MDRDCIRLDDNELDCLERNDPKPCSNCKEYSLQLQRQSKKDKIVNAIFKNIADGFDERGHFLQAFARLFMKASEQNQECLLPAAHALNQHYHIEQEQREKGILNE